MLLQKSLQKDTIRRWNILFSLLRYNIWMLYAKKVGLFYMKPTF